jgi:peptide methionine sulfoxide reductase msrA/msrB
VKGVSAVRSGFSDGEAANPTYKEVCTGKTGYAEVIQINYDPKVVSYGELLRIHMGTHDPTTLNAQGADIGTQYRSIIFTGAIRNGRSLRIFWRKFLTPLILTL